MTAKQHTARVGCNSGGEWKLSVSGTDVCQLLYRYRHPVQEPFPGEELKERLYGWGWVPVSGARWDQTVVSNRWWVWELPVCESVAGAMVGSPTRGGAAR